MANLKILASQAGGGGDTSNLVPYTGGTADIVIAHDIKIQSDSKRLYFGAADNASIYYDGNDLEMTSDDDIIITAADDLDIFSTAGNIDIATTDGQLSITAAGSHPIDMDSEQEISIDAVETLRLLSDDKIHINCDVEIDSDSKKLILGDGQDADIYYDGTDLIITSDTVGSGITKFSNDIDVTGNIVVSGDVDGRNIASDLVPYTGGASTISIAQDIEIDSDSKKLYLGDGQDASIYYDGTNLKIKADDVGSGVVKLGSDISMSSNNITSTAHIKLEADNARMEFGAGADAYIKYDGADLLITSNSVGFGTVKVSNGIEVAGTLDLYTNTARLSIPDISSLPGTPMTGELVILVSRGTTTLKWYNGTVWKSEVLT